MLKLSYYLSTAQICINTINKHYWFLGIQKNVLVVALLCKTGSVVFGACCNVLLCVLDKNRLDYTSAGPDWINWLKAGTAARIMTREGRREHLLYPLCTNGVTCSCDTSSSMQCQMNVGLSDAVA